MAIKRKNNASSFTRGVTTACLTGLVATMGILGVSTTANAAPSNIDPGADVSLTLHKFEKPVGVGATTDGTELPGSALTGLVPMEGVQFTATAITSYDGVTIDLSDSSSWEAIPDLATFDPSLAVFGAVVPVTSDAAGQAEFQGLGTSLYWVQEIGAPNHNVTDPMRPFLVTLPLAGPTAGEWVYDVHAYPKNSVASAEKTVNDAAAIGLGDSVNWTVSAGIPRLGDESLTTFTITDQLPAEVAYTSASVTATNASAGAVALVPADYTIAHDSGVVTLTLNASGLTKLHGAQGGQVDFEIVTTVNAIGDGSIENTATAVVNEATMDVDAETLWGAARIDKVVEGTAAPLAGAEFQVFTSEADAIALTNPVSVNGDDLFVTADTAGQVLVGGLKASDAGITYWIAETKAPTGYLLDSAPVSFVVTPGATADAVVITVENRQAPPSILPVLGGNGTVMIAIAGGLLLVGAVSFGASSMSRRKVQAGN